MVMGIKSNIQRQFILCLITIVTFLIFASQGFAEKKTIGVIMTGNIPYYIKMHQAFITKLSDEGYDVEILLQRPYPDPVSWSNAARKLIAVDVDIIVAYGAPAALAAVYEKTNIPIVYVGVPKPNTIGIAGKNITGAVSNAPTSSLIRYLKKITSISNLGVLYSESEDDSLKQLEELTRLSNELGFRIVKINIKWLEDVKKIRTADKLDALFLTYSSSVNMALDAIVDIAKANKLPTASILKGDDNSGVIITLSASPEEQGEIAAEKVIKILRGANPGTIPPTYGKNIELIFNLKENTAMGFKIPMDIVTEATKIIQ